MGSIKRKFDETPSGEPGEYQRQNGLVVASAEAVACIHDVSYPEEYAPPSRSSPLVSECLEPAKVFPFTLDPFQAEAIKCLENGESVMVNFLIHVSCDDDDNGCTHGNLQ